MSEFISIVTLLRKKVYNGDTMSEFGDVLKNAFSRYELAKCNFYRWRFEAAFENKLILALGFACLTGIAAQLRFYLSYTPVPVTGQVFAVLLSGVILGKWYGGLSQGLYAGLGALGLPWFADGKAGMEVLMGVTGGYIIGFIAASLIIGWFTDSYTKWRSFAGLFALMLSGILVIYLFGVIQVALVLGVGMQRAVALGALPFIGVDLFKAFVASAIARAVVPIGSGCMQ